MPVFVGKSKSWKFCWHSWMWYCTLVTSDAETTGSLNVRQWLFLRRSKHSWHLMTSRVGYLRMTLMFWAFHLIFWWDSWLRVTCWGPWCDVTSVTPLWFNRGWVQNIKASYLTYFLQCALTDYASGKVWWSHCPLERDRMAQGEPNQLYWAGFFLFGPFPEENMFGFSWFDHQKPCR